VQLVQRPDRQGGKHGALAAGLALARSLPIEYAAVFDGGASPPVDFLLQTVHHLMANGKLALVQAGSVISNRGWGPLKWVQAVALKWHAAVEQRARGFDGGLVAYDGTAAVWRLATVTECGGLAYDTGASDLDLALRVYLSGWQLLYLPHVRVPARMSPAYSRLRRQLYQAASGHTVMYKRYGVMVWAGADKRVGLRARLGVWHYLTRQLHCLLVALALLALPPVVLYVAPWQQHYKSLPFLVFAGSVVAVVLLLYLPITLLSPAYQLFSATSLFYKCCGLLGGIFGDGRLPPRIPDDTAPDSCFRAACRRPYFTELLVAMYFSGWSIAAWLGPVDIAVGSYSALMALVCLMLSMGQYFCPVKTGPDTGYSAQQGDVYRQYQLKLVEQVGRRGRRGSG
jgi:beta-mannan synthase